MNGDPALARFARVDKPIVVIADVNKRAFLRIMAASKNPSSIAKYIRPVSVEQNSSICSPILVDDFRCNLNWGSIPVTWSERERTSIKEDKTTNLLRVSRYIEFSFAYRDRARFPMSLERSSS